MCGADNSIPPQQQATYVRDPEAVYEPSYNPDTIDVEITDKETGEQYTFENLFRNEIRTYDPAPKEGFADTFLIHIRYGVGILPEEEPRRKFFETNFCHWLETLIGDN